LNEFDVVLSETDVDALQERPRFGMAAQTTQPLERVRHLVELMRRRFPRSEIRFIDTVCQPTKQRQGAAVELARQSDVVIVIGGANSNNTRELVATCGRHCARVHHVRTAADLRPAWFAWNGASIRSPWN
jgi:4-hydroxy-3-methylbut-2-enyl diphosphate reductase